jgi:hypothetical protein
VNVIFIAARVTATRREVSHTYRISCDLLNLPYWLLECRSGRGQQHDSAGEQKPLKAAAEVLGQHGVEGATIPRIAKHAGLTPGAVYRRFPDKDALLETVILGILEPPGRGDTGSAHPRK